MSSNNTYEYENEEDSDGQYNMANSKDEISIEEASPEDTYIMINNINTVP